MSDPAPVINPYRVLTFIIFVCSGLAVMQIVPQNIKDILPVISLIVSGALTVFFKVAPNSPANPSIAARVAGRFKSSKPAA